MRFAVKDTLTEEEIQSGLRAVIKDGLATQTMVTLTGGVFLVAFALKLGASNLMIGLLAAIPPLAQLIQIPSIYLVEKYRIRRAITVYATASGRIFWLVIGLYSIHRLAMIKEEGEVEEKIVVRELISEVKRPIRNFFTAGGLGHMVQFPFSIVRTTFEKVEVRKNRRNRQWKQ